MFYKDIFALRLTKHRVCEQNIEFCILKQMVYRHIYLQMYFKRFDTKHNEVRGLEL